MKIKYLNEGVFKNIKDIKSSTDDKSSYLDYCKKQIILGFNKIKEGWEFIQDPSKFKDKPEILNLFEPNNMPKFALISKLYCVITDIERISVVENNTIEIIFKLENSKNNHIKNMRLHYIAFVALKDFVEYWTNLFSSDDKIEKFFGLKKSIYKFSVKFDITDTDLFCKDVYITSNKYAYESLLYRQRDGENLMEELYNIFDKYFIRNFNICKNIYLSPAYFNSLEDFYYIGKLFKCADLTITFVNSSNISTYSAYSARHGGKKELSLKGIENLLIPGGYLYLNTYDLAKGVLDEDELKEISIKYTIKIFDGTGNIMPF